MIGFLTKEEFLGAKLTPELEEVVRELLLTDEVLVAPPMERLTLLVDAVLVTLSLDREALLADAVLVALSGGWSSHFFLAASDMRLKVNFLEKNKYPINVHL